MISREQLLELGFGRHAIAHRIKKGRLHILWTGVYAVGRPHLTEHGRWMAAVLTCGRGAVLSHESAATLFGIRTARTGPIHVSVPIVTSRRRRGVVLHRRVALSAADVTACESIPVTTPICTLVDVAAGMERSELEAAINEADKLELVDPERLRHALDDMPPRPGVGTLREMLDRSSFLLTDSELERRFLPLARRAGLPEPQTQRQVNGFKVDFYWPDLGLVVETDGLRYHRTSVQQARDRVRDQAHLAAGLTPLRFTRAQVHYEPQRVVATLAAVHDRLQAAPTGSHGEAGST